MFKSITSLGLLALFCSGHTWAGNDAYAGYGLSKAFQACNQSATTYADSLACLDKEAARMDARVNAAHAKRLTDSQDPAQQKHMRQAQALWKQYAQAECLSLWSRDTGNARDIVSECHVLKSARRLMELEDGTR